MGPNDDLIGTDMSMMSCPKCSFQQPQDRFCAKCGVNVENYVIPKTSIMESSQKAAKPLIAIAVVVLLGVGLARVANKAFKNQESVFMNLELNESSQMGVGAQSLAQRSNGAAAEKPELTEQVEPEGQEVEADASLLALADSSGLRAAAKMGAQSAEKAPAKFNQITATISLAEHMRENSSEKKKNEFWYKSEQANPIANYATEEITLKTGTNTFEFDDELIKYDLDINIDEITDKNIKMKMNFKRLMKTQTENNREMDAVVGGDFSVDQFLIIEDSLPRRARIDRSNSILSTLYKSQLFLSQGSDLVLIIKFENPTNAPQE